MGCVQKTQIIRVLAYLYDFVGNDDVIVTSDVDAFVMTSDLYKPLQRHWHDKKVWLFRYANSLDSGLTFPMSFIGKTLILSGIGEKNSKMSADIFYARKIVS